MADFTIKSEEINSVNVLSVGGYLDAHTAPQLEQAFDDLLNKKKFKVVVDFENLNYISSAGLGVFMAYIETMRENGGDIKFSNLKSDVYEIFDLLGFPVLYEFFADKEEAIKKFEEQE